jgi:hypothetical protein
MLIRNLIRSLRNLILHLLETNNHIFCVYGQLLLDEAVRAKVLY